MNETTTGTGAQTTTHPETIPDLSAEQLLAELAKADREAKRALADDQRGAQIRHEAQQRGQRWTARLGALLDEAGRRADAASVTSATDDQQDRSD